VGLGISLGGDRYRSWWRFGRSAGSREDRSWMWREIICDFDLLRFTPQVICAPPRRTTPVGLPSFPFPPRTCSHEGNKIPTKRETRDRNVQARKHSDCTKENTKKPPLRPRPSFFKLRHFVRVIVFKFPRHRSLVQASLILSLWCLLV